MNASPYEWDMFYVDPDMDFEQLTAKLKEKQWDVVMVGSKFHSILVAHCVVFVVDEIQK